MKKIFVIVLLLIFSCTNSVFASEADEFIRKYENAQLADFELVQNLDPYQVEDYYKYAWSPYPLFRTSIDLYFKSIHIQPGYYILTPRTIKDKDYVFFKQNGKVIHIIPVADKDFVTELFYQEVMPEPKRNLFGKIYVKTRRNFYRIFRKGKKQDPPNSYIEASTIDNMFFRIDVYYGTTCYSLFFKKIKDYEIPQN